MFTFFSTTVAYEDRRQPLVWDITAAPINIIRNLKFEFLDTRTWPQRIPPSPKIGTGTSDWSLKDDLNNGGISRIDVAGNISVFNTANGLHDDHIWCPDAEGNMLIGTTEQT
jgi:hypothetical protein